MPDFSELAKYLAEQIDIGESSVILDEPWTLSPVRMSQPVNAPQPISAPSPAPFSQPQRSSFSTPAPAPAKPRVFNPAPAKIIIPESAKSAVPSAYENAKTLEEFYSFRADFVVRFFGPQKQILFARGLPFRRKMWYNRYRIGKGRTKRWRTTESYALRVTE